MIDAEGDVPNGPGFSENEWASWRGEVTSLLREGQAWMQRHEREEFDYHRRIEEHVSETKAWIAQSSQHRADLAHRVESLESVTATVVRDVEALKTRMTIMFTTLLPIAGWAIWQLIDHFRAH